ncbi:MAG: hypothetical protein GF398_12805 [Chitinivibrionales bacterium]|nr:hypothetical protein [Chitinivibrionales bacterium]
MSIELLYIIPLVALSFLVLMISLIIQRKNTGDTGDSATANLEKSVRDFNEGKVAIVKHADGRLEKIENTVNEVSETLSSQRTIIEGFQGTNTAYTREIDQLKNKLRELQSEYDIVLSENYSLRARLKKIAPRAPLTGPQIQSLQINESDPGALTQTSNHAVRPVEQYLGDTRLFDEINLNDTQEFNLSDLTDGYEG